MSTFTGSAEALSSDRTIARGLVHRTALEEVFLTDFRTLEGGHFVAAARLPRAHHYYSDHTNHPKLHDPIAIFECVRQMLLCALHLHHNASPDMKSITASCRMEITDPLALKIGSGSYELSLFGRVAKHKEREGVTTRVVHEVEVRLDAVAIGSISVDTAQKPSESYQRLRMAYRDTTPPLSDELFAKEPVARIAPYLVGREQADNVVLLAPEVEGPALTARLRVPFSHSGMFDHAQDHVPGPVMMEAARQAGTLLVGEVFGQASSKTVLAALEATYERFAELDSTITVRASLTGTDADQPIPVEFEQGGEVIARMVVRMANTLTRGSHHAI